MTNGEKIKEIFPSVDSSEFDDGEETTLKVVRWADNSVKTFWADWWDAEYKEPSSSEKPNNPIRYIVLQVQKDSYTVCHGIFNEFYKAVGKCVCLMEDSDDSWLENDYKITDRSGIWRTETENGFGWHRKYVHENPEIVVEETWLVINGDVEE